MLSNYTKCSSGIKKIIDVILLKKRCSTMSNDTDNNSDVLIVGGGIVGYSTAYWLKLEQPKLRVTIVERDTTYTQASTLLSVGGLRLQFSEPENIQMSILSSHMLSNMSRYFSTKGEPNPDVHFVKRGYLLLSTEKESDILKSNFETQKRFGACLTLMTKDEIKNEWPWMEVDDIALGVHGRDNEGWFDPWLLFSHVRAKTREMGISFVNGAVVALQGNGGKLQSAQIRIEHDVVKNVPFSCIVNASGSWASEVAEMAERAIGLSGLQYPLFVKKCKRYVFSYSCPAFPRLTTTPMVIDHTGVYFRKESSGDFICGLSPDELDEPSCDNLDVDYTWFDERIWGPLSHRVPLMEALKVRSAWAGFYDYNSKDQNLIIGRHPAIENMILCNGSSGHGIQHGLAIGRANMEMILHGQYRTIDLSRLSYQRFLRNELVFEKNVF